MITSTDDGMVYTNQDARELIKNSVGGLEVVFNKLQDSKYAGEGFVIICKRWGRDALYCAAAYSLPFEADKMATSLKNRCKEYFEHN